MRFFLRFLAPVYIVAFCLYCVLLIVLGGLFWMVSGVPVTINARFPECR